MERSEENFLKDAKRLLAINAGEQKKLEKLHKFIDKRKREKERSLAKAQREAILKFCESSGKDFDGILHTEDQNVRDPRNRLGPVGSSDAVSQNPETKSSEGNVKKARQNRKLSVQEMSPKTLLPDLDLSNFLTHKNKPLKWRTRSFSSPTLQCDDLTSNEGRKESQKSFDKQQKCRSPSSICLEKNSNQMKFEHTEETKKPLSAILPPLVLPPLHSHRQVSIKEQNTYKANSDTVQGDQTLKKQYEELSDCRYLRICHPFIDNL